MNKRRIINYIICLIFNLKNIILMQLNHKLLIQNDVQIRKTRIRRNGYVSIAHGCRIGRNCLICPSDSKIEIGAYTSINDFSILSGGNIVIGEYVAIAARCAIFASNHVYENPDVYIKKQGITSKGIKIEDDVWLGSGVVVLDGVTIGKGSIIGAGSIVTKDIPPMSVAVGNPAKVIKRRER